MDKQKDFCTTKCRSLFYFQAAAWGRFFLSVKWLCAPRGPERRAGFFFELVLALVARGMFFFRSNGLRSARVRLRRGGCFSFGQMACAPRGPEVGRGVSNPPSLPLTPLSPQRVKGCSPLTIPKMRSKPKNASRFAKRIFLCFSHLRLRRRFYLSAELHALRGRNTRCEAANRRNEKKALSAATSFFPFRLPLRGLKGASSPFLVDPARRNRWWFSGSLLTSKENN